MTLVISLRKSKARRQKIAELLQAIGLSYRIVDAILGSSLPELRLTEIAPVRFMARFGRDLGPREIGCSLSHKLALEAFLSSDDSIALILEDDAVVRLQPVRSDWCPGRAVAGRVGLTQDRRNWRRAGTAGARNFVWKDYPHARNDGVLSRLRYIANGCHSAPKCDAPGQISLRHLPSRRVPTSRNNLRGGSHLGRAKRSCRLADSNRASRRHPTVPNPARPLISCLEVAPRTLSAWSFTQRAWAESRARTEQA